MNIGFTGTRQGMTVEQRRRVAVLLLVITERERFAQAHHGDCKGADAGFHAIVRKHHPEARIVGHPCTLENFRAYCDVDECREPLPPLERNRNVVDESDVILATPNTAVEQFIGSGTWATIRYARRVIDAGANKTLHVIAPNGELIC